MAYSVSYRMLIAVARVFLGLCLFFALVAFPQKVGLLASEFAKAAWNVTMTVGQHVPIPKNDG